MFRLLPAAVAGLLLSAGFANAFSWNSTKEQQALQLVRQFQALHQVPSVAISVTVEGQTVLAGSIGAGGEVVPGGEAIRYQIGSVTKQFTAAAILALIEDKAIVPSGNSPITFDTSLSDLFPNDVDRLSDLGKITVRRLLTMTSDLPSYTNDAVVFRADEMGVIPASRASDALRIIQRLKTYSPVGPAIVFDYSNTNYFVLALIIHVLKSGYEPTAIPVIHNYIHDRILVKAGMTASGFVGEPAPPGGVDAAPFFLHVPLFILGAWPRGAGDLVSTAADMARWNIALVSGNVINEASLQTMFAPAVAVTNSEPYRDCQYAMGWYVCDKPGYRLHQHDGAISGFMASNAIARQQGGSWMSVTVLANIDATVDIVALTRSIVELGN